MTTRRPRIQSVERAAAALRLLSGRSPPLSLAELSGELGLSRSTMHGILRTLQSVGFVEQDADSGRYRLGPALLHMGSSYLDGNELRSRALNWSDSLAIGTRESVRIGMLHDGRVLVVHHVFRPDDSPQRLGIGTLLPAHATALGKALLAHHRYLIAGLNGNLLPSYTTTTITDGHRLHRELDAITEHGWASEAGEFVQGMASIAAPIHDRRQAVIGAIGISGPIRRLCDASAPREELIAQVVESGRAISSQLGAIAW